MSGIDYDGDDEPSLSERVDELEEQVADLVARVELLESKKHK